MPVSLPPLSSAEVQKDPFPFYRRLLEDHPVYRDPEGYWILTRHADVTAALRNHAVFSSALGVGPAKLPGTTILTTDPPAHDRMRSTVVRNFLPGAIEALAPAVESMAHQLIDESAAARGSFDLMMDFAIPLPLRVIATLLGMDPERHRDYRRWSQSSVSYLARPESLAALASYMETSREFGDYVTRVTLDRARSPQDDLLSVMLKARREHAIGPAGTPIPKLNAVEYASNIELLLAAGSETTSALIGNAAPHLAARREIVAATKSDPSLLPGLIEECLRFEGPFQGDFRTTTQPFSAHGAEIPVGSKVALLFGAANRDPSVFRDPDVFDPARSPNPHVSFGHGIHHCLGAPLARMEARVAATVLAQRFQWLAPDPDRTPVRSSTGPLFRTFNSMPTKFGLY